MITTDAVVSPAYGRDYKSGREALLDFNAGKDFKLESMHGQCQGTYCSIRDFAEGVSVEIRYARKTKLVLCTVGRLGAA